MTPASSSPAPAFARIFVERHLADLIVV